MKATNVKVGDRIQVPWTSEPIQIHSIGISWPDKIVLRGDQRYIGIWSPDDEVPVITNIPRRDAK